MSRKYPTNTTSNTSRPFQTISWINRCAHTLIYSHIWVGGAATALGWQTLALLGQEPAWNELTLFLFSGTVMAYSLQRWFGMSALSTQRKMIIGSVQNVWPWLIAISAFAATWAFRDLTATSKWIGILAGVLSVLYILPISTHQRIRDLPGLKIFQISIVWAMATVLLPAAEVSGPVNSWLIVILFCSQALFIFAITLPFDLRDRETDQQHQTLTLPILLGWSRCRRIGTISLLLSLVMVCSIAFAGWINWPAWIGNCTTILLAMWMLKRTNEHRSEYFFGLWMDGLMFLPWLITFLLDRSTA